MNVGIEQRSVWVTKRHDINDLNLLASKCNRLEDFKFESHFSNSIAIC